MKETFSSFSRKAHLKSLATTHFDLLIIGGGVTGVGIALDAASRGLKTALIEKGDFASGTSSKSTKLIHGGLRYLKQLDIGLVRESGTEREVVNQIAPHLCLPEKMLLPFIKGGTFGKYSTSAALWMYDFLANVDKEDKRVMLTKEESLKKEPLLKGTKLKGAGFYAEYRTDDARLTIELIKKAVEYKAVASNYVEAEGFIKENGLLTGVSCNDKLSNASFTINAKKIVAAGGPWVDKIRTQNSSLTDHRLMLSKGVHIVVPKNRFPLRQAVYFDVPDGRMIFAIPRGKVTYIGTTDTFYTGSLDRIVATEEDRDYLLRAVNNMFPDLTLTRYDVISNWAGLRALINEAGKAPSELSRKDEIFESKDGLICIAGGKLTGYRKMAERIVDKVLRQLSKEEGHSFSTTLTKKITLTPKLIGDNRAVEKYILNIQKKCRKLGLDDYSGWYLVTNYGSQANAILKMMNKHLQKDRNISLAIAEAEFCIKKEMIQRAEDFFVRRTGRLYFDILSLKLIQKPVLDYISKKLNWSKDRVRIEEKRMEQLVEDATHYYLEEIGSNKESSTVLN